MKFIVRDPSRLACQALGVDETEVVEVSFDLDPAVLHRVLMLSKNCEISVTDGVTDIPFSEEDIEFLLRPRGATGALVAMYASSMWDARVRHRLADQASARQRYMPESTAGGPARITATIALLSVGSTRIA